MERCRTLRGFTKLFWPLIEPDREFVDGWHVGCIAEHLEEVARPAGCLKQLIINVPPRCMKSLLTCVFWFAHTWTTRPASRWMYSSFAGGLTLRDSQRCRSIIGHPLYQHLWGVKVKANQDTQVRFTNQYEGFRYAVTVAGQGMGEGADFLVSDDPINPRKAASALERAKCIHWWRTTMSRRANDERTVRKVIIMQRLHEMDLTGYLMADGLGWDQLVLPMRYEPRRYWLPTWAADAAAPPQTPAPLPPEMAEESAAAAAAAAPPPSADDLVKRLADAIGGLGAAARRPRDAITPTALQQKRPDLTDGPEGSGRAEEGELLWPVRFPEPIVAAAETELGPDAPGQYAQRPAAEAGEIFRRETFRRWAPVWDVVADEAHGSQVVRFGGVALHGPEAGQVRTYRANQLTFFQTIDTALTEARRSAYTACATLFATPDFDLGVWDVFRARLAVQYQYDAIKALRRGTAAWGAKTRTLTPGPAWPFVVRVQAVERKASGYGLIQQAAADGQPFHALEVEGDKVQRAAPVATMYANGKVYHPAPDRPWVVELEDELATFPNGQFKDQADVIAYGGYMLMHDKLIRGLCSARVMADPGEEADPRPDGANSFQIGFGAGSVTVDFPDDDMDPFGGMFGGRR